MYFKNIKILYCILCLFPILLFSEVTQEMVSKSEIGQKIFRKKLRHVCRFSAAHFSQMHTVDEWQQLKNSNQFRIEIYKICPKSKHIVKKQWVEPLFALAVIYAKDTGQYLE
jgi:hypothetical protein